MKILHVLFSLQYGGIETMLADLTRHQADTDDVTLLIINDVVDEELLATYDPRVRVVRMNMSEGGDRLWKMLRVNYCVRRMRPDVINCHNANAPGLIRGLDGKMVFTIHAEHIPERWLRTGVRCIAISDVVAEDMRLRAPNLDIVTIANGIETDAISIRHACQPGATFKIVNVARLIRDVKGQDILMRALSLLPSKFTLDLVGEGPDSDYLHALSDELGVSERVTFLGKRSRNWIYSHLADYDLMVHPSRCEGFGLTVVEGMAAGLPVAVSEHGAPAEIVEHGNLGETFPLTPKGCAEAISRIATDYPAVLKRASSALDAARRRFSVASMADAYRLRYGFLNSQSSIS